MELGMIGLGKMGAYMTERLVRGGHRVVGYDRDPAGVARVVEKGAGGADSLTALVGHLRAPRAIWLMVPAGDPVDQTIAALVPLLAAGDVILDGGNSNYKDTMRRAADLQTKKLSYVDVGTSGGVWGLTEGYSMMVGGDAAVVERLAPIFKTLAPAPDKGWGRVGPAGSGHFVKMVHNGIEYGLMQAYAEGLDLMRHKTEFQLDLTQIVQIWRFGSVIRSWLLDLTGDALSQNPKLDGVAAFVTDSGEGRWTVTEGIQLGVPLPVISAALDQRFRSQDPEPFANKLLAMMRHEFGGHAVKQAAKR
ncbi:MAG TPA: decarboxylating 6-phosphogluconate dehydrogenase [Candidatus Acidoferrales bacterium]|jgi:6-phosphogluconate dehydrogenase|nr:decarboxylating 6-phosphogluconate dehydrogenase [Candidatus Acidoferrales bacterium]